MRQIVEKIMKSSWLRKAGKKASDGWHYISQHLKKIGMGAVCLGAIMALVFVCTGVYDLGYNILVAMPPIFIIGGAVAIVKGIKKDTAY